MRVALVQFNVQLKNIAKNQELLEQLIKPHVSEKSDSDRVDLIMLPEMALTGNHHDMSKDARNNMMVIRVSGYMFNNRDEILPFAENPATYKEDGPSGLGFCVELGATRILMQDHITWN